MGANLRVLAEAVGEGFTVVCSCPTCGYLMKLLLRQGAYFSDAYQREVGAGADEIKVPDESRGGDGFVRLKKNLYPQLLKDDAYFSGFDALERIRLSENVMDLGEYLSRRHKDSGLTASLGEVPGRMVYYAPCHQREQKIRTPYLEWMQRIPGLTVTPVGSVMECCGMGGSLGYKQEFYEESIRLAAPLIEKIRAAAPDAIVTDCLSCRLQFQHLLPYPVYHPLEILARAGEK
jgi:glycerol-3-phosphate dehydrogenase subunit C